MPSQPNVFDADTYLQNLGCSGLTVRIKTLYAANRLKVRLLRQPLFSNRCEGWENGPVYPELWRTPNRFGDVTRLGSIDREILTFVFKRSRHLSGKQLSKLSHAFPEWVSSRQGFADKDRGNREITLDAILSALTSELHIEAGEVVCAPLPSSREDINTLKQRMGEVVFFNTVLKPLLPTPHLSQV